MKAGGEQSAKLQIAAPEPAAARAAPDPLVKVGVGAANAYALCGEHGDVYVVVDVAAKEVALRERLPMNLALVLDRSGSMESEGKLEQVKEAARFLVRNLQSSDVVSLISYDDRVDVLAPATELSDPARVIAAIDTLSPRGMTNVEGGLTAGYQEVSKHLAANQINRVVLLSDGLANVGVSDPRALGRVAAQFAAQGISTTAMGVGVEYSEETMMLVSEYGHGNYHFMGNIAQIPELFQKELSELKAVVALDTALELEAPEGAVLERVYGFDDVRGEGRSLALPLGDLFSGDGRRVVLRYKTTGAATAALPFSAHVRYRPAETPDAMGGAESRFSVQCTNDARVLAAHENRRVRDEVDVVVNADVLDHAMRDVTEGDRELAKQQLDARIQAVQIAADRSENAAFKEQVGRLKAARSELEALDGYGAGSAEVQGYVKGNRAASKAEQKKRMK